MGPLVVLLVLCTLGVIAAEPAPPFELWVEPPVPVVAHGGSLRLTLRTTCSDPSALGDVETSFLKRLVTAAPGVTVVELLNVTEWDASVLCFYNCGLRRKLVATQLVVYSVPKEVTLEPVPPLAVGESHELRCSVAGAAPARNLTVTLRLGGEVAHVETFPRGGGRGTPAGTVTVTWRVRARRRDAGRNVTCHAALDLAPHGERFDVSSAPEVLRVYEFPADPELEPHVYAEAGEAVTVTCAVGDVFPAARFELALANRTLPVTVSRDGHRATAEVTPSQAGDVGLVCTVTVGPARRRKEATVHVYSFPVPRLNVSTPSPRADTTVTGLCALAPGHSPELLLQIRARHRVVAGWGPSPLPFALPVREDDDGTELSCDAKLPVGGKATKSSEPIRLSVTAAPRMDDGSCPPRQNWTEGGEGTLRCSARGNPPPRLECAKDGVPFPPGVPRHVTRAHAGTYQCRATNALGSARRGVSVWVHSTPGPDPVLVALVPALLVAALVAAAVAYAVYYRKKKIRRYRLREQQRRLEMGAPRATPRSDVAALNGSTPEAQP